MVIFNELRITEDAKCMVIDFEIEGVDVYKPMYIQSVYLEYYKNANAVSMPSEKAYRLYDNENSDPKVRAMRLNVPVDALRDTNFGTTTFVNGLFYVVVMCGGEPESIVGYMPCTYDDVRRVGAVLDWKAFYDRGMAYINSLFDPCSSCPEYTAFEHFAVLWNALKMAISTCDWNMVSELWDKFLLTPEDGAADAIVTRSGCGCK